MAQTGEARVKKSRRRYANAAAVLPPDVYREVRKHYIGVLYVGRNAMYAQEREDLVMQLRESGVSIQDIATAAGVSPRRVSQIIADAKKKNAKIDTATPTHLPPSA